MDSRFNVSIDRAEEIIQQYDDINEVSGEYNEAVFAVHPGFCIENDSYTAVQDLTPEDYSQYTQEFHRGLEESFSKDKHVNVVYRSGELQEASSYLGDKSCQVDNFIESSYGSGFITSLDGQISFADALKRLNDEGRVEIMGEMNGLCVRQFRDLLEEVERNVENDFEVVTGNLFPERPVSRTQGTLHWEDEVPAYLQAIEFRSPY